jgi:protein-S-isoprenylcysteine O-methyltransferase Ste14
VPGLAYRIGVEEKILVEQFGEEYLAYKKRTRKLIPGIW